jgi:hypothetical protein
MNSRIAITNSLTRCYEIVVHDATRGSVSPHPRPDQRLDRPGNAQVCLARTGRPDADRDVVLPDGPHVRALALGPGTDHLAGAGQDERLFVRLLLDPERCALRLCEEPLNVGRVERAAQASHTDHPLRHRRHLLHRLDGSGEDEVIVPQDHAAVPQAGEDLEVAVVDTGQQQFVGPCGRNPVLDHRRFDGVVIQRRGIVGHALALSGIRDSDSELLELFRLHR